MLISSFTSRCSHQSSCGGTNVGVGSPKAARGYVKTFGILWEDGILAGIEIFIL
jgi:hypothetical protein